MAAFAAMDYSSLRLADLPDHDTVIVSCRQCGHLTEFVERALERLYKVPPETLLVDLPKRLRCKRCGARDGFRVTLFDERERYKLGASERIVVRGR
jgi:hypothetical protein